MNLEELRELCLSLPGITEETPFGADNLVYKVMGKMYALIPLDADYPCVALKNTPEKNEELKSTYPYITEAYHFNKVHWIMVLHKNPDLTKRLIEESYQIVKSKLPKKCRMMLEK